MISEQDMGFYTRLAKGGVGYIVMGDVAPKMCIRDSEQSGQVIAGGVFHSQISSVSEGAAVISR